MPAHAAVVALAALLLSLVPAGSSYAAPPPDAEHAMTALVESPRHGEWIDVAMPKDASGAEAPPIRTWISHPERADAAPVVIVIHEIFGLTDWVRGVADALAAEGFVAVAPDLLSGKGPNGGGSASFEGDAVRAAIRELSPEEVAQRLDAVRAHAIALPSATSASAVVGFCWGGSAAFRYAADQPALRAAVVYYGTAPTEADVLKRIACPVHGEYGGDDARVTATVEATTAAMKALGKGYDAKVRDGAGHGFLRQQTARDGRNLAAAEAAWRDTLVVLRRLERGDAPSTPEAP